MEEKPKKIYTKEQALKKAEDYCAFQERCQQEVRDKLYYWGLHQEDVEATIAVLISEGFINEERFAKAFAGGKFRIKKWGRVKIKNELMLRRITKYCISKALEEIDDKEYLRTLNGLLEKKAKEIKEKNKFKKIKKIVSYAVSRGYENELVWDIIKERFEM
jgi:regulatory protein